jgi:hypothetical protein
VVAEASSTTPAGPAPGACAGTWSAVAVTVRSVVTATDNSRAAPSRPPHAGSPHPASRHLCPRESPRSPPRVGTFAGAVEEQRSGVIGSRAADRALSWRPGWPGRSPEHAGSARRS